MKNLFQFLIATLIIAGMFSCNVIDITKKRYSNGYYISSASGKKAETHHNTIKESKNDFAKENKIKELTETPPTNIAETNRPQEIATDINVFNKVKSVHKKKLKPVVQDKPVFAIQSSKLAVSLIQMQEKKLIDKTSKNNGNRAGVPLLLLVIIAICIPPLAVFLKRGMDRMFWISVLLLLLVIIGLAFIPYLGLLELANVILALLVVFDAI